MKTIGEFNFPSTPEECKNWKPFVRVYATSSTSLIVMQTRIEGLWCAYAMGVEGIDHETEKELVLLHGDKIREDLGLVLFPFMKDVPYAL